MIEELDFETYLFISPYELKINLFDIKNQKNLYEKKLLIQDVNKFFNYNLLDTFLENNVFKIEKLIGGFLKSVSVVVQNLDIINISLGVKRKNYEDNFTPKYLEIILTEANDIFKENYQNEKIIHFIINKYFINDIHQPNFNGNLNGKSFSLEIQFIAISNNFINEINKILEKFHIRSNKWFDEKYIKDFFKNENLNISEMVFKIQQGVNEREVTIVPKNQKRVGFFERFFQLFS